MLLSFRRDMNEKFEFLISGDYKKLIIIYRERQDNLIHYIEVVFHERNYQHLTGL